MKCPKCKTGIMVPENDFEGHEVSRGCLLCGERSYSGFTIRQPKTTDTDGDGARINAPRRLLTTREKELIAAKQAEGISIRKIAEQIGRSESSVTKHIYKIRKEACHV